jgi:hypothetical protein
MAREYQNMRDRNILNAWEKGGKFEGKAVTDDMLLSHLRERRDGLDLDDALYDEYGQRLTEYTFAVDNSKMELRYAEHKVGDAGMAGFYRKAAAKLPKDSEAWRNMMKLAAQYKDRASTGGGGGGRGRGRGGGYNSAENRIPLPKEVAYDTMIGALTNIARAEGILNTKTEDLGDLRVAEGDASRMVALIDAFNNNTAYADYKATVIEFIRKNGNPNFPGDFSFETLGAEKVNKDNGEATRLRKAQAAGHKTDSKGIAKEMEEAGATFLDATAAQPLAYYEQARKEFDAVTADPTATPIDLYLATNAYRGKLESLHDTLASDPTMFQSDARSTTVGHLKNEILSLSGKGDINAPTLWEDSRGTVAAYHPGGGEAATNASNYQRMVEEVRILATGQGVISRVDGDGQPTSDPEAVYGVVPLNAVGSGAAWVAATGALPQSIDFEGQTINISHVMTAIIPVPINVTGVSAETDLQGRPLNAATAKSDTNIANQFTMPDGTELTQYWDSAGTMRWTSDPAGLFVGPNQEELKTTRTPEGLEITVPIPGLSAAVAGGAVIEDFDPNSAISTMFSTPASADLMVNKVSLTSYSAWLNSTRTATSDPGVAYAMDPDVMREAIIREVGNKPEVLAPALRQAEQARTDYLRKTPDIDIRIRQAAAMQMTPTMADTLGVGESDIAGLRRDVAGFYDRLQAGPNRTPTDIYNTARNAERDKIIKAALEEDTVEAYRMAGFTVPSAKSINLYTGFNTDPLRARSVAIVGPGSGAPPSTVTFKKNETVEAMRHVTNKGLADALGVSVGGLRGPTAPMDVRPKGPAAPTPTAPPPKAAPPKPKGPLPEINPYTGFTTNKPPPPPPPKPPPPGMQRI